MFAVVSEEVEEEEGVREARADSQREVISMEAGVDAAAVDIVVLLTECVAVARVSMRCERKCQRNRGVDAGGDGLTSTFKGS